MGFYLRKSIKAGPFRFNLSKSGIGVSTGIKGLRIGTGPRGNYIHMGRGGFYYTAPSSPASPSNANSLSPRQQTLTDTGYGAFTEIDSGDLAAMTDSSSAELLAEFDSKRKKLPLTPFINLPRPWREVWIKGGGAIAEAPLSRPPQPQNTNLSAGL